MPKALLRAFHTFMQPHHPCSLAPALRGLSAAQQLPLVQLLARLLEGPEQPQPLPQQPQEDTDGSLSFCSDAAKALASRCLAKGRIEHCRGSQGKLLVTAPRLLEAAETAAAAGDQPGACPSPPAALLQGPALDLVAALLNDEAELLQGASPAGASDSEQHHAQGNAIVVNALVKALPRLRSMLAAAAAFCAGDTVATEAAAVAVHAVVRSWCVFGTIFGGASGRLLLPSPACQTAAAGAAEMLLRLAPLLPRLPIFTNSPDGSLAPVAAGSVIVLDEGWQHLDSLLPINPPQCLAIISAGLASRLLRSELLGNEPAGGSSREPQSAATGGGSGSGSGSDIAHGSYGQGLAATAWSAAMAAFKFQWALASQAAEPALVGTLPEVFPLRCGAFAAGGASRIAHDACDAALVALLGELDGASDPQQKLDVQR